jgi:FtsP/CotA-like multicopper oxidase with cupredoxin domain
MLLDRRHVLRLGAAAALAANLPGVRAVAQAPGNAAGPADYTIRIATGLVELGPGRIVSTTTYNGQFPGPLMRLKEGQRVVVDIHNDTDTPEQLHYQEAEVDFTADNPGRTLFHCHHQLRRDFGFMALFDYV